jgi:hypothetical protein
MRRIPLFLVSLSLLTPPNACCCLGVVVASASSPLPQTAPAVVPTVVVITDVDEDDCPCCHKHVSSMPQHDLGQVSREPAPSAPTQKQHSPTCPAVRKFDRVRVLTVQSCSGVDELQPERSIGSEAVDTARSGERDIIPHWPDGPARYLLFSVLQI